LQNGTDLVKKAGSGKKCFNGFGKLRYFSLLSAVALSYLERGIFPA
jgi:hypothetical protein